MLLDAHRPDLAEEHLDRAAEHAATCGSVRLTDLVAAARERLDHPPRPSWSCRLTTREIEVAELAGTGLCSAEIGRPLYLGSRAIDSHLGRVYRKLVVSNRIALAQLIGAEHDQSPYRGQRRGLRTDRDRWIRVSADRRVAVGPRCRPYGAGRPVLHGLISPQVCDASSPWCVVVERLVVHSLGTAVAYEAFHHLDRNWTLPLFVTRGSPAPSFTAACALNRRPYPRCGAERGRPERPRRCSLGRTSRTVISCCR